MFVDSVKMNNHIFEKFSPSSQAIPVFPYQSTWQYSDGESWFMTGSLDVTPKTTEQNLIVRNGKSEAEVTNRPNMTIFFNVKYLLENNTQSYTYTGRLIGSHT